jgi:hypothetical protein
MEGPYHVTQGDNRHHSKVVDKRRPIRVGPMGFLPFHFRPYNRDGLNSFLHSAQKTVQHGLCFVEQRNMSRPLRFALMKH